MSHTQPTPEQEAMAQFFDTRANTYDSHMLENLDLDYFYKAIADCFPGLGEYARLADLGCGTGLELERLFERCPTLQVTGVDLSAGMLEQLRAKYPHRSLELICASYFDVELGNERYDCALSTYSLHHFTKTDKVAFYRRIRDSLAPGGFFVEGDYTVSTAQEEQESLAVLEELSAQGKNVPGGEFVHVDTPFTPETQRRLLLDADFAQVEIARKWKDVSILIAYK